MNIINLAERCQQRLHARHAIGEHAATLRALDAEAIEEAACQARARAYEAQEAQAMVESAQLRATMDALIARVNPYPKPAQAMVESAQLRATMDTLIARSNPYTKP